MECYIIWPFILRTRSIFLSSSSQLFRFVTPCGRYAIFQRCFYLLHHSLQYSWLLNVAAQFLAKQSTRLYISSDPAYYSRIMDESRTEEVDKNYDLEKIRNAIKSIPESHFIPFEMYLSGFKYREIAERTGVSLGTIKSRIFHCRKKLKAILAE